MTEDAAWVAHPYEACLHKLARAREHRDFLADLCHSWLEEQTAEVVVEREGDSATWQYRVPPVAPPPLLIGAVVSDVLGQLRSTLDHLAAFLVMSRGRAARVGDAKFPVCWDAEPWPAAVRKYLPGVTGPVLDLLAAVQPFKDRRSGVLDLLVQSSNMDKHRYLLPVVTVMTTRPTVAGRGPRTQPDVLDLRFEESIGKRMSPGQTIATVVMAAGQRPPPLDVHLTTGVAFGTTQDGGHGMTSGGLTKAADVIEGLVRRLIAFDTAGLGPDRADA